ncbi:MAG TPA: hypothetical protein VFC32_07245 [Pseudolabrys sp.]|jgi:hypothetical protein|nr:hypothetical protein [Pseudolabrys sp.]
MFTLPNPLNIMFPGAGGNFQTFDFWSPRVSVNFAGNPAVEREVTEDVASYGSQIGWLNDIVIALAKAAPDALKANEDAEGALTNLKDAMEKIEAIKQRRKTSALDTARDALAKLGSADKDAYKRLVTSLDPNDPPDAA